MLDWLFFFPGIFRIFFILFFKLFLKNESFDLLNSKSNKKIFTFIHKYLYQKGVYNYLNT